MHTYLFDEEAMVSISTNIIFCFLFWWMTGDSSPEKDDKADIFEMENFMDFKSLSVWKKKKKKDPVFLVCFSV